MVRKNLQKTSLEYSKLRLRYNNLGTHYEIEYTDTTVQLCSWYYQQIYSIFLMREPTTDNDHHDVVRNKYLTIK